MKKLSAQASQNIADRLAWHTAGRDQAGIARDLAEGKDIPEVYGLGEAGLFEEFFFFLDQFKISNLFAQLDPQCHERQSNVQFPAVMLIYLMRIVSGLSFFWHTHPVLLRSQALMRLVGFNGREIREGTSARGTKNDSDSSLAVPQEGPTEIRGPFCADSIATYIAAISASALEAFFNAVIRILAAHAMFPKQVHALLDASEIESTQKCEGCGSVSKEKAPELRLRAKRIRKVMETVFGFKIWVVWDPQSKLPLAMRFSTIDVHDTQRAKEVVQQAIANLEGHAKITTLACDRGFLDGPFLWWLDQNGVIFLIPAKSNMVVYQEALDLTAGGIRQTRNTTRSEGFGKNKHSLTDFWDVVGITGLTCAGFYGPLGSGSHENRVDFVPNPINAVVVLDDPYRKNNPNVPLLVLLTNGPVEKPLRTYDGYDARSEIENGLFREAKQGWFIERPAKNTMEAFRAHTYLTIITMALTTAFRAWMDTQDKRGAKNPDCGIRKFREQIRQENGNKLIVFDVDRYAIFDTYEVFTLCNRNVQKPRGVPERITKDDILRKYGADRQ